LLDSSSIKGTKDILLNIISGDLEITMGEIGEIIDYLQDAAGQDATIIWGNGMDLRLGDQISVTIIATGFDVNPNRIFQRPADVVELVMEDNGFEINLDDELLRPVVEPEVPKRTVSTEELLQKVQEAKDGKRKSKKKNEFAGESNPEDTNSWFSRQFSRFFEDKDSPESDQML
jgi:cell division protein FtsZ